MQTSLELNEHQRRSVDSMKQLEQCRTIRISDDRILYTRLGINGNETGSGKTRSMVALIEETQVTDDDPDVTVRVINFGALTHEEHTLQQLQDKNTTIIIAGGSLRKQWVIELMSSTIRYVRLDNIRKLATTNIDLFDVLVVNNTVYKALAARNIRWRRFIYDEADTFIVPSMPLIQAKFTWLVTATWRSLDRYTTSRRHQSGMFQMLRGVDLSRLVVRTEPVQDVLPPIQYIIHRYTPPVSIVQVVENHISPVILVQIDAGDIRGAMEALGGDCSSDNLVDIVRGRIGRSLEEARFRLSRGSNDVLWEERIRSLEVDLQLVNDRFDHLLAGEHCSICTDTFTNPCLTPCHHVYCLECLVPWLQRSSTCPQCRAVIEPKNLTTLVSTHNINPVGIQSAVPIDRSPKSRMDIMEELLVRNRTPEQRIIIFSEHDASLHRIQSIIPPGSFSLLQGHSTTREAMLDNFKTGRIPILLLNSRINGAGIDLPMTTDIILFHHMSDFIKEQAVGRGQRLGRETSLRVHEFSV
jgi:hypothetical protein